MLWFLAGGVVLWYLLTHKSTPAPMPAAYHPALPAGTPPGSPTGPNPLYTFQPATGGTPQLGSGAMQPQPSAQPPAASAASNPLGSWTAQQLQQLGTQAYQGLTGYTADGSFVNADGSITPPTAQSSGYTPAPAGNGISYGGSTVVNADGSTTTTLPDGTSYYTAAPDNSASQGGAGAGYLARRPTFYGR